MARKLAVVPPGAQAEAPIPTTIKAAAEHSERALLVAMRNRLAGDLDAGLPAHALAPVSRQLREIDREIRAIDARAAEEAKNGDPAEDQAFDASAV